MASGRGLNEIVLAQLGALNFFVWAVAGSMSSTQLRTYTGIEYILYMYNLGTAPNVQNWPGFAVCTPRAGANNTPQSCGGLKGCTRIATPLESFEASFCT